MENLQVREVPIQLPIEVHAYYEFDESERGREYEMRLVIAPDQGGQESTSPAFPLMTNQSRHRVTLRGQGTSVRWLSCVCRDSATG